MFGCHRFRYVDWEVWHPALFLCIHKNKTTYTLSLSFVLRYSSNVRGISGFLLWGSNKFRTPGITLSIIDFIFAMNFTIHFRKV